MKADHYDSFAESYSAENESRLLNAYYERPAMMTSPATSTATGSWTQGAAPGPCPRR